jgi:hypothetical protein
MVDVNKKLNPPTKEPCSELEGEMVDGGRIPIIKPGAPRLAAGDRSPPPKIGSGWGMWISEGRTNRPDYRVLQRSRGAG